MKKEIVVNKELTGNQAIRLRENLNIFLKGSNIYASIEVKEKTSLSGVVVKNYSVKLERRI